jgi:hypothetical protein
MSSPESPRGTSHAPRHPARHPPGDRPAPPRWPGPGTDRRRPPPPPRHRPCPLAPLPRPGRRRAGHRLSGLRPVRRPASPGRLPPRLPAQATAPDLGRRAGPPRAPRPPRPRRRPLGPRPPARLPAGGDQLPPSRPAAPVGPGQARGAPRRLGGGRRREGAAQDRRAGQLDDGRRRVLRGAAGGRAFPPGPSGRRSRRPTPGPCSAAPSRGGACRGRSASTTAIPGA